MPTRLTTISTAEDHIPDSQAHETRDPIVEEFQEQGSPIPLLSHGWDGADPSHHYRKSPMYRGVVETLREEASALNEMPRALRMTARRKADRMRIHPHKPGLLLYREKNGVWTPCLVESEIEAALSGFHDDHGHFSAAFDPESNPAGPHRRIQEFEPMNMIGMDFLGPIQPTCETGARYILVVIDYFSRFVWTATCSRANDDLVASTLKKACYAKPRSIRRWSQVLREASPSMNTRLVRVHGYTPAELLLGFNPRTRLYDTGIIYLATLEEWQSSDPAPEHLLRLYNMYRGERRQAGSEAVALANALALEK
ncbi:hypothetical protein PENARI_c007G07174 [Penicillium arizonense]|uniref:Integrase catalytic domain-containing protein n=1 Tax=Penicillium arizonense TaxID=1835702 RepID=A0A1F5LKZ0_PENAI|nr:hypothetical protein PENARI_c007G07174 [Penicillium arizonense]OGE53873.1 hypothetical protein PENARI_c007G07174 [Penicillium arizonense]